MINDKKEIIYIKTEYIKLGQFLKITNIISSGSEAKIFLNSNNVLVNNELEIRRGKKLFNGYEIDINGSQFIVEYVGENNE